MLSNGWSTLEKRGEISNTEGRLERRWEALWEGRAEVAAWLCPLSLTAVEWAALAASWPQPRAEEQIKRCHQSPFSTEKTLYLVSLCSPQSVFALMLIKCSNCAALCLLDSGDLPHYSQGVCFSAIVETVRCCRRRVGTHKRRFQDGKWNV